MAFFKKLKERLFKSSSKIEEGLDAIVEDGGAEEAVAAAEVAETVEEIVDADPVLDTAPEPEPEPVDEVLAEEAAALSEVQREAEILSDDPVDADLIHPDPIPEPEPEPEPETRPQPPRDPLADFLNQSETTFKSEIETRRERPEPRALPPEEKPKTALKDAPRPVETRSRRGAGDRNANQARIDAILYSRIFPCWDGVADLPFPDRLNVRMKLQLNPNGSIAELELIEPARRPLGSSPMGTAVDRALRAVRKCAPYKLPQDDYDNWRDGTVNLGPAFTPTSQR